MDINKPVKYVETHRFHFISWGATAVLVAVLLGAALWWTQRGTVSAAMRPEPTAAASQQPTVALPASAGNAGSAVGIGRALQLKTSISASLKMQPVDYKVERGDSLFGIAKQYNVKPESILYSNEATLNDNPANLTPGMTLTIPPEDGLLYTWQEGDTIEKIANEFKSDLNGDKKIDAKDAAILSEAILNYPGNNIDLTNPVIKTGQELMIPGGQRELVAWLEFVPTVDRNGSTTATSELGGGACKGGPIGSPGIWPTDGPHTISGNDYSASHLGIDITASLSTAVLASGDGVVVFAGWSQYGYGNVIQIDHGNGFSTVYAHLSQINVSQCQAVYGGQVIGIAGTTGNSTGVHLHFEVREGGVNVNPWSIVH
ncbi:MAG TPA: M23 family metallopeptidase [Anaerolineales bacterium]|nr:M23 family metallopeptidase [Anaerolineales bacterium]